MTYIYLLAGENLELAEADLRGFLSSQGIEEKPERVGRLAETRKHPEQLRRLALTHEVVEKDATGSVDRLDEMDLSVEGSYAVRCKVLDGKTDSREVERHLGEALSSDKNNVDLEEPETVIRVYVQGKRVITGKLIDDLPRGLFNERSNEKRPFSSPVSLDPVLARVLINLSEVPAGGRILDPFCGTGGILIEAGLCGILPLGADVKEDMVEGTGKNLDKYGIINHEIRRMDAEESLKEFKPDALVTDLPYGKASKVEGKVEKKFLDIVEEFDGRVVFMYDKSELGGFESDFKVFIHKNLTRHVFVT